MKAISELLPKPPQGHEQGPEKQANPEYRLPYKIPEAAARAMQSHNDSGKRAAILALFHDPHSARYCDNCGGGGLIYIRLLERGPFRDPPNSGKKPIAWVEEGGKSSQGWYIVASTLAFECQICNNINSYQK